jgi:hypothetical protein
MWRPCRRRRPLEFRHVVDVHPDTHVNFTKHLAKPPERGPASRLAALYEDLRQSTLSWEDLRWIRSQTKLPIAIKGIQHPDDARLAIDDGADVLCWINHVGRQASSAVSILYFAARHRQTAGATPVMFDSGVRSATDAIIAPDRGEHQRCSLIHPALRLVLEARNPFWLGSSKILRLCPARPSGSAVYTVYTNPVDAS